MTEYCPQKHLIKLSRASQRRGRRAKKIIKKSVCVYLRSNGKRLSKGGGQKRTVKMGRKMRRIAEECEVRKIGLNEREIGIKNNENTGGE